MPDAECSIDVVESVEEHRHPADPALARARRRAAGSEAGCAPTASRRRPRIPCTGNSVVLCSSGAPGDVAARSTTPTRCGGRRRCRSPRTPRGAGPSGRCAPTAGSRLTRLSGKRERLEARARRCAGPRRRRRSGSLQPGDLQRDDPLRVGAGPHLVVPVVPRPDARQPELRVVALRENTTPANPAMSDGKQRDAQTPATSMSAMRAWMSQHPLRISSKRAGSIVHSSLRTARPPRSARCWGTGCPRRPTPGGRPRTRRGAARRRRAARACARRTGRAVR